jgi:hypothetical protein
MPRAPRRKLRSRSTFRQPLTQVDPALSDGTTTEGTRSPPYCEGAGGGTEALPPPAEEERHLLPGSPIPAARKGRRPGHARVAISATRCDVAVTVNRVVTGVPPKTAFAPVPRSRAARSCQAQVGAAATAVVRSLVCASLAYPLPSPGSKCNRDANLFMKQARLRVCACEHGPAVDA